MNWITVSIRQPVTVVVGVVLVLLAGLLAFQRVPIQLTPNVEDTIVAVTTRWEGASPLEVEQEIVDKQEEKLQGLSNLRAITSTSQQGQGRVRLEFSVGTPKETALREVSDKLREVASYPEDADEPVVDASDPENRDYIAWFVLTCGDPSVDVRTLQDFVEDRVKPVMERVPGLSEVNALGGREREVQVRFDAALLAQRGIPVQDLVAALRRSNRNVSAGAVAAGKQDVRVRMEARYARVEDVEETVVVTTPAGPVRVRDVAEVVETFKEPVSFVRSRGVPVIAINAQKEVGSNVIEVMSRVRDAVEAINAPGGVLDSEVRRLGLSGGLRLEQVYDQTIYIDDALALVTDNLWVGGLLAIGVLFVFLRSVLSAGIIGLSIPISVIGAVVAMLALGRTINVISLAGMAFAVGMVVDNAIVVLENAFRHIEMGKSPMQAAIDGTKEVFGAVLASTLTTLVVFVPILLIEEEAGQLFRDIALAVAASVGLSLIVAVTVVPACAARLPRRVASREVRTGFRGLLEKLASPFERIPTGLSRAIRFVSGSVLARVAVIAAMTIGSVVGTAELMPPSDYLPLGNRNLVFGLVIAPPGYSLEQQQRLGDRVEATIRPAWEAALHPRGSPEYAAAKAALPQVPTFDWARFAPGPDVPTPPLENYFLVSFDGQLFHGGIAEEPDRAVDIVPLFGHATRGEVAPGTLAFAFQMPLFQQGGRTGQAVKVNFSGEDLDEVTRAARTAFGDLFAKFPGTVQPDPTNFDLPTPEMRVVPRLRRLGEVGMTPEDLGAVVQSLGDGAIVGEYLVGGQTVDLKLVARDATQSDSLARIAQQPVATPLAGVVPLSSLADLVRVNAPPQINREGRRRSVTLQFTPPPSLPLEAAVEEVRALLDARRADGSIPPSIETTYTGSASKLEAVRDAMLGDGTVGGALTSALVLALVVCYLLMCVLFQSFVQPLVILFSVPLATLGGFAALRLVHDVSVEDRYVPVQKLDVLTMLGFVILIGVVVNNAILLVHQALNFMRGTADEGPGRALAPRDAIAESVRTRVRPILMTTLTSILGMLPLVVSPGSGSELYRGLGAVVLGGLLVSTVFTLVLVPLLFSLVCDLQQKLGIDPAGRGAASAATSDAPSEAPSTQPPADGSATPTAIGIVALALLLVPGCIHSPLPSGTPSLPEGLEAQARERHRAAAGEDAERRLVPEAPVRLPEAIGPRVEELERLGGPESWRDAVLEFPADLAGRPQRIEALPLDRAVKTSIEENLGVEFLRVEAAIAREGVVVEDAEFDFVFRAEASAEWMDQPRTVPVLNEVPLGRPESSGQEQRGAASIGTKLRTGASLELEAFLERFRDTTQGIEYFPDPVWTSGFQLSAVQPLLRGAGTQVNTAATESARLSHQRARRRTEAEMLVVAEAVEFAYWDLHEAWERMRIQQRLTEQGVEVERVLRERREFDVQPAEWSDALAVLEERRAGLVRARRTVKEASDRLKDLLDDPDLLVATEVLLAPADAPVEPPVSWRLRNSIARAFDARPEVAEAILAIEDARIREVVARNHVLPSLEARVDIAFVGMDGSADGALADSSVYNSWDDDSFITAFVGLAFEVPFGNRRAEAQLRQARYAGRASLLRYEDVLRRVVVEVKRALRDLEAAHELLTTGRESRIAQTENLRALLEEEKERRTLSPEFLALKFQRQERLADAQREEVRALASVRRSIAAWRRAVGEGPKGGRLELAEGE